MIFSLFVKRKTLSTRFGVPLTFLRYKGCKNGLKLWDQNITTDIKHQIEKHWRDYVLNKITRSTSGDTFYVLPMFPYPSGNLHMGHVRVYSISDTMARFYSLCGSTVIHPMGWDSFGLPAENAAIQHKIPPATWTKSNIETMKTQLDRLAFDFDWSREFATSDPSYYKWTQFIFLKLYEHGLAYQSKASVNWDPVDQTVLADEQVDENGCSWRSGAKVEQKVLKQWFIKTTAFAKQLYEGLESDILEDWQDIVNLQKHWIGMCDGVTVNFEIKIDDSIKRIEIWTRDPYKLLHADYLLLKSSNPLALEIEQGKNKTVYNTINGKELQIFIKDCDVFPEGKDFYLGCAKIDSDDRNLADSLGINIDTDSVIISDSDKEKDGMKAVAIAKEKNLGGYFVSSKLKDWLVSRQRYWGTPIPIIHCKQCGAVPVPYEDLPVKLPERTCEPLSHQTDWIQCKCPKCNADAKRETDTLDTFVDSSWYYYRFLDPKNLKQPFDPNKILNKTPVNLYIGGKEHAVLHLYYARFISHFLHSLNWTQNPEPFKKLLVQGMVMGQSFKVKSSGKYLRAEEVVKEGKKYKEKGTNEPVLAQWEKMSKSKMNGESPERLLAEYGCDTTRLIILGDVPPNISRNWSDATFPGILNWQHRLWLTMQDLLKHRNDCQILESNQLSQQTFTQLDKELWSARNLCIASVTYNLRYDQKISVGISRMQKLTNALRKKLPPEFIAKSAQFEITLANLIVMLSPMAPHFSSELWSGLQSAPNRITKSYSDPKRTILNSNTSLLDSNESVLVANESVLSSNESVLLSNESVMDSKLKDSGFIDDMIDWDVGVLEQRWPVVNHDYDLQFLCKVDGQDLCDLPTKPHVLSQLTTESALQLVVNQEVIQKRIKRGIKQVEFELYPDCRAIIKITTQPKVKVAKNVNIEVNN